MPRRPRDFHANQTLHVVRRAHNRQQCFVEPTDYGLYVGLLTEFAPACACTIHAYALMHNHVHLLCTPTTDAGPAPMMQQIGQRYSQHFNCHHRRTGTLWEGRYYASRVDSDRYALACYRYIELNPVRAGLVERPHEYRWSSHRANAGFEPSTLLVHHAAFATLASAGKPAAAAYLALFAEPLDPVVVAQIRSHRGLARA
jgi:putative transposase